MKIRPVGAELLHADGRTDRQTDRQTDMTKLILVFHNANVPKKKAGPIFMPCNTPTLISYTSSPAFTMMIMAMMTVILFCSIR